MNQHNAQRGDEPGDAPVDGQAAQEELEHSAEQPDLAEHEAAVPSSTTDALSEDGPDLAEHEAAVPSSAEEGPPGGAARSADGQETDVGGQSRTAIPPTGDDRVDEALSRLAELDRLAVTGHAEVVEDVHRALQDTLAEEEE